MHRLGKAFWFVVVAPLLIGFDFWTKDRVEATLPLHGEIDIIPDWLSILHASNPDVAFSLPVPLPLIAVFGVVAVVLIAVAAWRLPRNDHAHAAALAFIAGGALGNLIDRIDDQAVTDFVRVYTEHPAIAPWLIDTFGTATWPIFNVADVALIGGVVLWLWVDIARRAPDPEPEPA